MDTPERLELVKGDLMRYGVEGLAFFIEAMPTQEARNQFRYEILQAEATFGRSFGILNELPEMEDRFAVIELLGGLTRTEGLIDQLEKWKIPSLT